MIRIGILGYGNLGRGVENAIRQNDDMELTAVFTRRNPADLKIATETAKVYSVDDAEKMADQIDVMIICGGSATDLPVQTPKYVQYFNVIDSFDTHANIPRYVCVCIKAIYYIKILNILRCLNRKICCTSATYNHNINLVCHFFSIVNAVYFSCFGSYF